MFYFDARFNQNPPATTAEINLAEKLLNLILPASYQEFLVFSNGGEGAVGIDGYVSLWPVDQLSSRRDAYGFLAFAPKLVPIGSNGASESFVIKFMESGAIFGFIPFADLNEDAFIEIDSDFWKAMNVIGEGRVFD